MQIRNCSLMICPSVMMSAIGLAGLTAIFFVEVVNVFPEVVLVLVAFDSDLEVGDFVQEDKQNRDRLLGRASDSDKQRVACRLLEYARDVADVYYRLTEQYEWHGI